MLAKNDDHTRSIIWRSVMSVTSVVIILIAVFFLVRMFTMNPLEGTWDYEDSDLIMTIKGNNTAIIKWPDEFDDNQIAVSMDYDIDSKTKTFSLRLNTDAVKKAADSEGISEDVITQALDRLDGTYDYNMEQNQLTLTDREYGSQLIFEKE
ncbi:MULTISPECIES: hypothetical protein [Clostridia]|uniref:DUF4825 domain-containing protein n=1 Tax=Ruminococcus hominis TaxID=2763065 RepID=A0ABR7G8Z2_9FIRM|nr:MULTISPECIES: hypothetical protein [Clostridia]MBC5683350.1 hypothetical protein [Ruminococcus hominis]MCH4279203.1 hypothetical protein [Mediterraneibacter sp. NSJ-151]RHT39234.1 hypothetical protein DW790_03305 [Firmicutes bacterium AM31-12AC]